MKFENEWQWVEDEEVGAVAGTLLALGLICVIMFVVSLIAGFYNPIWFVGLAVTPLEPAFLITAVARNKQERIKNDAARKLYKKIKKLPDELKANIGEITVEEYRNMTSAEIEKIHVRIDQMVAAYNSNRAAVGTPKVTAILHSLEDATESYKAQTQSFKELA